MKKANAIVLSICIVIIGFISGCGPIVRNCGGETVMMQSHPEKQFRQYVKTTNANLKGTADILKQVNVSIDASTTQQVTELREKLDNYSSRTEDIIKAAFDAYNSTPCDRYVRKAYFDLLENINKENTALEKLKIQMSGSPTAEKILAALKEYREYNGEDAFEKKN